MSHAAERDAGVLAWMREAAPRPEPARFGRLALALFRHQAARCAPYARFCAARGVDPEALDDWRGIPPVPTGAFKELALRSFPEADTCKTFRTSGSSGQRRGALHLDSLEPYEASLLPSFAIGVLPDRRRDERARLLVLAPSPEEAPDSSLSHMFGVARRALGDAESDFFVRRGALELARLRAALEAVSADALLVLCGTAFAFVHLLDALAERDLRLALPPRTRVMETGGFKGRSRELPREALYAAIEARLGVPPERIVNQYGMTELGSQFYDSVLHDPDGSRRKLGPPWARVRLVDPETNADAPSGSVGIVTVVDLANTGSVLAVQTADLGRAVGDGFEVLGRAAGAEARGCSIAADEMLAS
ncbi:MAG: hypothetical protein QNK04_24845 [Myxococcota bacterium]|nr:hypothetical protein [Myxococcota bacterium]